MATQFGFRLFEVELLREHKKSPLDFSNANLGAGTNQVPFTESLRRICAAIQGVTVTGILRYRHRDVPVNPEETEDTQPSIRLLKFANIGSRIDFEFRYGRRGSHDLAMADSADEDAELFGKAPTNPFRAFLYLPISGTKAVLAVEARNRICPADNLMKLIGVSSKEQDEERPDSEQIGWWRFRYFRITDPDQWEKFITQGQPRSISLIKHEIRPDGTPGTKKVIVRQDGLAGTSAAKASKTLGMFWIKRAEAKTLKQLGIDPSGNTVQQLATLVEVNVDAADFDEAGFTWEGPDGTTKFIGPDDVVDQFTYAVGKAGVSPSNETLVYAVESKLRDLAPSHGIPLDL